MNTFIIVVLIAGIMFWLKWRLEALKTHDLIYDIVNENIINVYDKEALIATINRNKTIVYTNERPLSIYKLCRIEEVNQNFDKKYKELLDARS